LEIKIAFGLGIFQANTNFQNEKNFFPKNLPPHSVGKRCVEHINQSNTGYFFTPLFYSTKQQFNLSRQMRGSQAREIFSQTRLRAVFSFVYIMHKFSVRCLCKVTKFSPTQNRQSAQTIFYFLCKKPNSFLHTNAV